MIEKTIRGVPLWCFENLSSKDAAVHFVSGRAGGVSPPPYDSLNLSFNVGDDPQRVLANRARLAGCLGIPLGSLTLARQVHDDGVTIVSEGMRGEGSTNHRGAIEDSDAMLTGVPGICLMILLADCVPILLHDSSKGVIGAVHAGWKGTLQLLSHKAVKILRSNFGCSPHDIIVGIGPSIGPCCYEVGPEVAREAERVFGIKQDILKKPSSHTRGRLDLWKANFNQIVQAGVPEKNIETAKICTRHHVDRFYSYRHEQGMTGRFGAGIMLRK